jgi:hypothetical protein
MWTKLRERGGNTVVEEGEKTLTTLKLGAWNRFVCTLFDSSYNNLKIDHACMTDHHTVSSAMRAVRIRRLHYGQF